MTTYTVTFDGNPLPAVAYGSALAILISLVYLTLAMGAAVSAPAGPAPSHVGLFDTTAAPVTDDF